MTLVVPYDGSDLSKAALVRAAQFDTLLEEGVIAVTIVPRENAEYARDRGWIEAGEPFDAATVSTRLERAVSELAPGARHETVFVDRSAQIGTVAVRLRKFAIEHDASIVFLGSENAGRIASSISVGQTVAADRGFDTLIVSHVSPTHVDKFRETGVSLDPADDRRSAERGR
ncbi:universal stress protein [Haloparvum alkalitolerans]|uniref:universal stress protein n=1 Tax=Haloparvum alkalitolerans TaxID=1042953 RepID=UPI003CF69061